MRRFLLISVSVSSLLGLAACNIHDPLPMGRGYSSYGEAHKSAPGAHARDVGYDYSNEANQSVLDAMRPAVADLVEKLDQKLSFNVDTIYLSRHAYTAFYGSLDHLLRDELTMRGYMLSVDPKNSVNVELYANDTAPACNGQDVYLALAIDAVDEVPSDIVGGYYDIPKYDYKPAGHLKIDIPACEG